MNSPDAVSLILLQHNEAATVQQEIRAFYDAVVRKHDDCEFIIAEDGSTDGTRQRIEQLAGEIPFRLVGTPERKGYQRAVLDAVGSATKPFICVCDGGLKHDPGDFWLLWQVRREFDLVVGRKTNRHDQWHRRAFTAAYNLLLRAWFHYPVYDSDSGFRLFNRKLIERVLSRGLIFRGFMPSEVVLRAIARGLRYHEVPISYRLRQGESRALPLRNVPRAVGRVIVDLWRMKRSLRQERDEMSID